MYSNTQLNLKKNSTFAIMIQIKNRKLISKVLKLRKTSVSLQILKKAHVIDEIRKTTQKVAPLPTHDVDT